MTEETMRQDTDDALWTALRDRLEAKRRENFEALRNYPPQVAGCDTHYRYLAAQRAAISGELRRLELLRRKRRRGAIGEFVSNSTFVDEETVRTIRAELGR